MSITYRYDGTIQHLADIASRGSNIKNLPEEWWDGARWLTYPEHCPKQKEITRSKESQKEAKMMKKVMCTATEKLEDFSQLLKKK